MILDKIINEMYGFEFDLEPETSSMVKRIGWTKSTHKKDEDYVGTLKVVFKTADTTCYYYDKVPLQLFKEFLTSKSYGKFLNAKIKDQFKYIKVTPKEGKEEHEPKRKA